MTFTNPLHDAGPLSLFLIMRSWVLLSLLIVSGSVSSQVIYPFNPDSNGDSLIGASDLIDMLSSFGVTFQPTPITLDEQPLDIVLTSLIQQVNQLQTQLTTLEAQLVSKDSVIALTWGKSLAGLDLTQSQFIEANLSHADLAGANLSGVNLSDSYLYLANLNLSNLSHANLINVDLFEADLTGADLSHANLSFSFLGSADLTGATVEGTDFLDTYLTGAILDCLVGCPVNLPSGFECVPSETCGEPNRFNIQED